MPDYGVKSHDLKTACSFCWTMLKDFALFFLLSQIIMVFLHYQSLSWEESDYLLIKNIKL